MEINDAKRVLYQKLKAQYPDVIGAGIKEKKGEEVIVIFLLATKKKKTAVIPKAFEGFEVVTELHMRGTSL